MGYMRDRDGIRLDGISVRRKVTVDDLPTSGLYYAHRGSARDGRPIGLEGSLSAYRLAAALGAHILDFDVRRTRDGVLVVGWHDTDSASTSDITVPIASTALPHLPQHYQPALVGSGWGKEDFITVEQILAEFGGRIVLDFELKNGSPDVADMAALVARYGLQRSVLINTANSTDATAIVSAGLLLHFFSCRSTALIDTAASAGAWMIDVPTDAATALVDYALTKNFHRIIGGFVNTAGTSISTDTFAQLATRDARIQGYASNALGYLGRPGGSTTRSTDSIIGAIRTGRRGAGWLIVNSSNLTDWLSPGNLYTYKAGAMVYTFGGLAGSPYPSGVSIGQTNAKQTITAKVVFDTLPSTLTQSTRFKLYGTDEATANASSNSTVGYVFGIQADGVLFLNSVPVGGGSPVAVLPNVQAAAPVAGVECTATVEIDDQTAGTQNIRITRQDAVTTLSAGVSAGTVTSLPIVALTVALANGAKIMLPDGTTVNVNGAHIVGATTLTISSIAVPAMTSGAALRSTSGWVNETTGGKAIWRGQYHSAYTTQTTGVGRLTDLAIA